MVQNYKTKRNTNHFKKKFCNFRPFNGFRVTHTRGRIDTIDCPDDQHLVARNMQRIGINKYKKKNRAASWLFAKETIAIQCDGGKNS